MVRVLVLLLIVSVAHADDRRRGGDQVDVDVDTTVKTPVDVDVDVPVEVGIDNPVNVNTAITQNRNVARQTPNAYFNYTPNFLQCGRVLGFQYGNPSGVGSIGIPLPRDKACDIWLAVNEAQENGHVLLSYAFMCEIKNIRKVWGLERCQQITDTAGDWWLAMAEGDEETVADTIARFEPPDSAVIAAEEHSQLEEEIAIQQKQIYYLQEEVEKRTQAYEAVQSKIDQYEQAEEAKQQSLDEFLEDLEKRAQNE